MLGAMAQEATMLSNQQMIDFNMDLRIVTNFGIVSSS
jgi:hypothetical protein